MNAIKILDPTAILNPLLNRYDVRRMELNEVLYWQKLYERHNDAIPGKFDNVYFIHLEGTGMFLMPDQDILAFNRAIGLGFLKRAENVFIEKMIDIYKIAGTKRFFVQLSPMAHRDTEEQLIDNGFTYYNDWVKLFRHLDEPIPQNDTDFRIVEIGKGDRKIYGEVISKSFGFPHVLGLRFAKSLGAKNHRHFMAMDGKKPVAVASMFIHGKMASMAGAGTLPEYRNAGAQSALLSKRLQLARNLGCEYAIAETAKETIQKKVSSFRNMIRAGFEIAYTRPNYIRYL